jgi:hypothetical protein
MGLFDFLTGGHDSQVIRQCKRVANINGQPEDRDAAARWLAADGSEQAIYGLLGRFDISIENQMKDAAEKELVFELLLAVEGPVLAAANRYVVRCKSIAFPLRLIATLGGNTALVDTLLSLLSAEAAKEDYKPDRKRQFLIRAAECRDARIVAGAAPFLKDFDEGVRYAAAEAIIAQESDEGRPFLLEALANSDEESNRLRVRIAEVFASRKWGLDDKAAAIGQNPPVGWRVAGGLLAPA